MKIDDDIEYVKTNRELAMTPKKGHWYICDCDVEMVSIGSKCTTCGKRLKRTIKKETNA
jgi:hypothetical protein